MGRSRTASAPQYVGKPDHLRGTRAGGAVCRQDQRCDGARCPIVLLEPPRLCAGLCHRNSMASHWLVGRFVRRVVANPHATFVGIEAPSGVSSGLKGDYLGLLCHRRRPSLPRLATAAPSKRRGPMTGSGKTALCKNTPCPRPGISLAHLVA